MEEIKETLRIREETIKAENSFQMPNGIHPSLNNATQNQEQSTLQYMYINICVIIGFVIFGYVIKYVLKNLTVD